jgi:phosphatidylserine synthase
MPVNWQFLYIGGHIFLDFFFVKIVEVWSVCAETVLLKHEALLLLLLLVVVVVVVVVIVVVVFFLVLFMCIDSNVLNRWRY